MEKNIKKNTYRYIANDIDSYESLAKFIAPCMDVQATFFPFNKTIVIAFPREDSPEIEFVADHINNNALNFRTEPIEDAFEDSITGKELDPASYNEILDMQIDVTNEYKKKYAEIQNELKEARAGEDRYRGWWTRSTEEIAELKAQVNAMITLMQGIIKE